jgi:tetratricopeptide (TPR) repeat protein
MVRLRTGLIILILTLAWGSVLVPDTVPSDDVLNRGIAAARSGQLEKAIQLWSQLIKKNPRCYAAYVNRGTALMMSGHVRKSIEDWHLARKYSPLFAYAYYEADFISEAPGNQRILNFAKSLELDPDHFPSVALLGATYQDIGRSGIAADLFRKSIELTRNPMLKNQLHYWAKSIEGPPREE